jgi:hypothetical protein
MNKAQEEDNFRLRNAAEHLRHCRDTENHARKALAEAIANTKRAKEKHESLFMECERRAVARKLAQPFHA